MMVLSVCFVSGRLRFEMLMLLGLGWLDIVVIVLKCVCCVVVFLGGGKVLNCLVRC